MGNKKITGIGGQALIEGIMMRGPKKTSVAVRLPNGEIDISELNGLGLAKKNKFCSLPIIRGVLGFVDSLATGYKALMISAEKSMPEDEETDKKEDTAAEPQTAQNAKPAESAEKAEKDEKEKPEQKSEKGSSGALMAVVSVLSAVLGVALAVALFMFLPAIIFNLINAAATPGVKIGWDVLWRGLQDGKLDMWRAAVEGVVKVIIFIAYIAVVSLQPDIKRVFKYHGAEHKTIFCYENGLPLTVENCRKQIRFHPRCGTSFMFLMIAVSIIISTVIVIAFPAVTKLTALWVAIKILLIPLFCGIGYELIKYCGRHDNRLTKIIAAPGLWIQRLTTKEPDDDMLEVAIAAMEYVIPENAEDDKW